MLNKKKGFTIIEVIIATFILTVGTLGVFSTIQFILVFTRSVSSRLGAIYLAQGGIEVVRNIRDSNWLKDRYTSTDWDDGIPAGSWCWVVGIPTPGCWESVGGFRRQITITKPPLEPDKMVVSVQVLWVERGGSSPTMSGVTAATELYNWR